MALSPQDARLLSPELATLLASLQQSVDVTLCQFAGSQRSIETTLPRRTYDGNVLQTLMRIYTDLGWQVSLADRDGAVTFSFTTGALQEA